MLRLSLRMLREVKPDCLNAFVRLFLWRGGRRIRRFLHARQQGYALPPVIFASVTGRCNLSCQGCWVTPQASSPDMDPALLDAIITQAKSWGNTFFGILGGEPLLYEPLLEILARHPDAYFQVFTNGLLLTDETARAMASLQNVTPLVSIEGLGEAGDERRGGNDVTPRALEGIDCCRRAGLITGVATSVCRTNLDDLATDGFLGEMARRGAHYVWYYIYRPVGPRPTPELALSGEEILRLRRFMVEARCRAPVAIVDSYWDADGNAFCPAASGLAVHVNPAGAVEPCPPVQFADTRVTARDDLAHALNESRFLKAFGDRAGQLGGGCILMDDPERLLSTADGTGAFDTTGRDGRTEVAALRVCPSHHLPGKAIPERSWLYRFAKRRALFGLAAYG